MYRRTNLGAWPEWQKRNSLKRGSNGQLQGTPPAFTYRNSEKSRIFPNL